MGGDALWDEPMILITGASGTLGSEICRRLVGQHKVLALDIDEYGLWRLSKELGIKTICDSVTRSLLWETFENDFDIWHVINCAAVKHVFTAEQHPIWASMVNYRCIPNMLSRKWRLTQVSTDKAVVPINRYGMAKMLAEDMVKQSGNVVRLVNIHDSRGCAEEIFREQIAAGGPVIARDPRMRRYFTTVEQAAEDVIAVMEHGNGGVYMPDPGEAVAMDDIIREMIGDREIEVRYAGAGPEEKLVEDILSPYEQFEPVGWSNRIYKVVRNGEK